MGNVFRCFVEKKSGYDVEAEGLFDPAHKKPLPPYPKTIAIVTSSAGAAVHDMIRILRRRRAHLRHPD